MNMRIARLRRRRDLIRETEVFIKIKLRLLAERIVVNMGKFLL